MNAPIQPDAHLVTSASGGTMRASSRPLGGVGAPSIQGASPTIKESTVSSMPPACPVCQEVAILWGRHEHNGVTEANYCCAQGHGWITKWVTP